MRTKNFVVEMIESDEKRVFVIRELSPIPQQPPITREVCLDSASVGEFFASDLFAGSDKS